MKSSVNATASRVRYGTTPSHWKKAEPLEEGGAVGLKAGGRQSLSQAFSLEVNRSEGEQGRYGKTRLLQPLALPVLGGRVIDLEHADTKAGMRVAQRKRIEAGA
jgi:hypothetical protein